MGHRTVGMASAGGEGTSDSNNSAVSDPDTWRPNLDDWSLDVASVTTSQVRKAVRVCVCARVAYMMCYRCLCV